MDYKKKYNEALERARQIKDGKEEWRYSDLAEITPALTEIFPELAESEDERIRKAIRCYIEDMPDTYGFANGIGKADMLAYLEKQKYDRMKPIYDARESFESALEKAWKDYDESGARTITVFH